MDSGQAVGGGIGGRIARETNVSSEEGIKTVDTSSQATLSPAMRFVTAS
jgi:hypothetical protein